MRIAFATFGCKINQYDTDLLRRSLADAGNSIVSFEENADVYVVNTCSVTAKTDYQCRQAIRAAVRRAQGARVVVTGCYAETRPDEIRTIPGVSLVVGNAEKARIPKLLAPGQDAVSTDRAPAAGEAVRTRTRAFLKIQDGCDSACSYCIVPSARGKSRSVDPATVRGEFESLVQADCPEVVLSGIHIGRYGADLTPPTSLTALLAQLLPRRISARVRISSIEPREITPELIRLLGNGVCRHLHVPLQSGDDAVLTAMRRDYSTAFYRELLENISGSVPGIALGADVMVGFPGEGDAEFENTLRLVESTPLTHLHVFSYSPRPGTDAAGMKNQIPEQIKKKRSEILRDRGAQKNLAFRMSCTDSVQRVVVEGKVDPRQGMLSGLTDNYIRVLLPGLSDVYIGKEIAVRIREVRNRDTIAELC